MTAPGWLAYAGTELADNHRVRAYLLGDGVAADMGACNPVRTPGACACSADDLGPYSDSPAGDEYAMPPIDPAPWYDPLEPDSADFLGVLLLQAVGLDSGPFSRQMIPGLSAGGSLGRLALGPRPLAFRGLLFARTSCGMEYGKRWLTEALQALRCDPEHSGELCVRACCPEGSEPSEVGLRHLYGVGMIDPPTFVAPGQDGRCCDHLMLVDWTMAAESPWLFDEAENVCDPMTIDSATGTCFDWCPTDCPEPAVTPACAVDEQPDAYCEPWSHTDSVCCEIPAQPDWRDAATVITVDSGADALSRLILKVWENPLGLDPPDVDPDAWACKKPCNIIEVHGLPTSSKLRLDGRIRRPILICPGGATAVGDPYVRGQKGLVEWLEVGCVPLVVCAYAAASGDLADNVTVTVATAVRYIV